MGNGSLFTSSGSGLWRRADPDFQQALARLAIVAGALWFSFTDFFAAHALDVAAVAIGRWAAVAVGVVSLLILASILRWPGASVTRRIIGITHDITANAVAMYVGGQATAFFAVIYVVIVLASGVRFGAFYLGYAALCSLAGFGVVYALSPYWAANHTLSLNTVLVLTVVPAYMFRLILWRQRTREDLERRAMHDALTGLMNRAGFEQELERLVRPGAYDQVLVYLDLDRFKSVNDAAGHAAGDALLVQIAGIVRECVRQDDVCGRIGGDEFCVLLRNCPMQLGTQIATRIRDRIHSHTMQWSGEGFSVGASIGVVSSRSAEDGPSFLRLADAACYAAKNAGRNTVHVIDTARMHLDTGQIRSLHQQE
jgi:diguanylate cyclase (GGDEF)-like protein